MRPPPLGGPGNIFVGHLVGSAWLGDRYGSHDDYTANSEICQTPGFFAREWPVDRIFGTEKEARSSLGILLHVREVLPAGKIFVRRKLNQLGLPP